MEQLILQVGSEPPVTVFLKKDVTLKTKEPQ